MALVWARITIQGLSLLEILVSKDKYTVIRKAESFEDLIKLEEI